MVVGFVSGHVPRCLSARNAGMTVYPLTRYHMFHHGQSSVIPRCTLSTPRAYTAPNGIFADDRSPKSLPTVAPNGIFTDNRYCVTHQQSASGKHCGIIGWLQGLQIVQTLYSLPTFNVTPSFRLYVLQMKSKHDLHFYIYVNVHGAPSHAYCGLQM